MSANESSSDAWYVRESSDPACSERLLELKELLTIVDRKWKVAGQYLFVIDDFWSRKDLEPPTASHMVE